MVTGTGTDMIISDRMDFNNLLFVSTVINDHLIYSIPTIVTRRRRFYTVSSIFLRYQVVFSIFTWITPPERPDVIVCYVLYWTYTVKCGCGLISRWSHPQFLVSFRTGENARPQNRLLKYSYCMYSTHYIHNADLCKSMLQIPIRMDPELFPGSRFGIIVPDPATN